MESCNGGTGEDFRGPLVNVCIPSPAPTSHFPACVCTPLGKGNTIFQGEFSISLDLSLLENSSVYLFLTLPKDNFYLFFLIFIHQGHSQEINSFLLQMHPYILESSHRVHHAGILIILITLSSFRWNHSAQYPQCDQVIEE